MSLFKAQKTLLFIKQECDAVIDSASDSAIKKSSSFESFSERRRAIHLAMKELRQMADDKATLSIRRNPEKRKYLAELSCAMRSKLADVERMISQLQHVAEADARKAAGTRNKSTAERCGMQLECVELCKMHLAECRAIVNRTAHEPESFVISTATASAFTAAAPLNSASKAPLPPIDAAADFAEIDKTAVLINADLDVIERGVCDIKQLAVDMGRQLTVHDELIFNIQQKADCTEAKMQTMNAKLKATLRKVMDIDKFIVNVVLIVILLSLAFFIYTYLKQVLHF